MHLKLNRIVSVSIFCQTVYRLFAVFIILVPIQSHALESNNDFAVTVSKLVKMAQTKQDDLLHSNRNHKFYLHRQKQSCVVVLLHGLFQSPLDHRGLSEHFFKLGCNVVVPLLAGHWEKNELAFHQMKYLNWIEQIQELVELAQNLGENVFLVGHSAGGLLAFNIANQYPEKIKALILFSPALQLTAKTIFLTELGSLLNLNQLGNTFIDQDYDTYKKPAQAGVLVMQLNQSIFGISNNKRQQLYQNFKTPTLIFSTEDDDTISHQTLYDFQQANPQFISLITYKRGSGVFHDNIQRGPLDVVPAAPLTWQNPFYDNLLLKTADFLGLVLRLKARPSQ